MALMQDIDDRIVAIKGVLEFKIQYPKNKTSFTELAHTVPVFRVWLDGNRAGVTFAFDVSFMRKLTKRIHEYGTSFKADDLGQWSFYSDYGRIKYDSGEGGMPNDEVHVYQLTEVMWNYLYREIRKFCEIWRNEP